ncbi:MAG: phage minor head protein [Candidatus Paceibacterota bacterium]|jgi:SPP1 gp7 family putative phage head morphogenesis protein
MIDVANIQTMDVYEASRNYDPTRTTTLRNLFVRDMNRRFAIISKAIWTKVVTEDCFGLVPQEIVFNAGHYLFPRSSEKVAAFMKWLKEQTDKGLLSVQQFEQIGESIDKAWQNLYITDSYKRGVIRARYELQKAGFKNIPSIDATGGIEMSMMTPLHMDRLGLLYSRVYSDLKGITAAMDTQISRILTQGIADGDGPILLARKILGAINGTGMGDLALTDKLGRFIPAKRRAEILARTEIIRAHHQATIQEYRNWGVWGVNVLAEMVTAGDSRVCSICEALTLKNPYTLDDAMNLLPRHPQCRCLCLPYEVGVDTLITKTK